ncbi:ABC transporter ATP-binding protein [Nitrincola sp. MINF-07-Sa-05]|uniref:ABC transporter ATP-binding protein n=1 Tax=Nitrincola salilacus TaxID=3400273 RepID=UPI00391810D3
MSSPVLEACDVTHVYKEVGHDLVVLDTLNFTVHKGERVAIVGSSGSGKTTLLNILGGLEQPTSGSVSLLNDSIYEVPELQRCTMRNRMLGFVYQFHHLLNEFTALENIAMPLLIRGDSVATASQAAKVLLAQVGLSSRADHKPGQLSGGERQRVAIARALVTSPACVLMDEPTGNLDHVTAHEVQQYLDRLNQELDIAFVIVTHNLELAGSMERAMQLTNGRLEPYSV